MPNKDLVHDCRIDSVSASIRHPSFGRFEEELEFTVELRVWATRGFDTHELEEDLRKIFGLIPKTVPKPKPKRISRSLILED